VPGDLLWSAILRQHRQQRLRNQSACPSPGRG
jgi:hypothetical protein